jgi:hypothetical protein
MANVAAAALRGLSGRAVAVRATILEHLPAGYRESINWGMLCYEVPRLVAAVPPDALIARSQARGR